MKTYLITGAAGFIGSNLVRSILKNGHSVINVDNFDDFYHKSLKINNVLNSLDISEECKNINDLKTTVLGKNYILEVSDIRDKNELTRIFADNSIDIVIHLAAKAGVRPSIEDPMLYQDVNIHGTMNILECCKEFGVKKFVMASSSSVYGNNKKVPFSETDVVDYAISPYAATKKSCEVLGHTYHHLYDMDIAMLRFFTVYGPGQRPDLAIHKFTKMIEEDIKIPFYGDGSTKRDYTFIDDIIDGIVRCCDFLENNSGVYEIFNLGESQTISLSEMVATIEEVIGKKAKIDKLPMQPGDVNVTFADISKAKNMLGYNPSTNFKEGIEKFIKWYRRNKK